MPKISNSKLINGITIVILVSIGVSDSPSYTTVPNRQAIKQAAAIEQPTFSRIIEYPVPQGSGPHDVAPTSDGKIWYTAQRSGELQRFSTRMIY